MCSRMPTRDWMASPWRVPVAPALPGTAGGFRLCYERHYRAGHHIRGAPGQMMTSSPDQLQAGVRERLRQPARGLDGNDGVVGVGEQQHRRPDRRDSMLQLGQFPQQGALLGQESAP